MVRKRETSHEGVFPESTVIRRPNASYLLEEVLAGMLDIDGFEETIKRIKRLLDIW